MSMLALPERLHGPAQHRQIGRGDDGAACQQRPDLFTALRGHFDHGGAGDTARPSARALPSASRLGEHGRKAVVAGTRERYGAVLGQVRGRPPCARVSAVNPQFRDAFGHDHRARAVTRRAVVAVQLSASKYSFAPV